MICKPLIIRLADDTYQAWCPACRWESSPYPAPHWARVAAQHHETDS